MQQGGEGAKIAGFQAFPHPIGQVFDFMQRLNGLSDFLLGGVLLLGKYSPRVVGCAGKKQHQIVLQFRHRSRPEVNRLHPRAAIGKELDEIHSPECRCVFILFADMPLQNLACDMESRFRQVLLRQRHLHVAGQGLQYVDANARRGPETGTRGDLRCEEQIHVHFAAKIFEGCNWNLKAATLDLDRRKPAPAFAEPQIGRDDLNAFIRAAAENRIKILIDGGVQHSAVKLFVVGGEIGPATAETNPHWTANYEHWKLWSVDRDAVSAIKFPPYFREPGKTTAEQASTRSEEAARCPIADRGASH